MDFHPLLERVMESGKSVRHSIVADMDGNIEAVEHRLGVENYLSEEETTASMRRAAMAWKARKLLAPKIGNGLYAVAAFEKITRITFPLGNDHLLFVTMDSGKVRTEYEDGGQRYIIEHVLKLFEGESIVA